MCQRFCNIIKVSFFFFTQVYLSKALLNDACSAGHVRQVHSGTGWRHEGILQMWGQYRFGRRGKGYSQPVYFGFIWKKYFVKNSCHQVARAIWSDLWVAIAIVVLVNSLPVVNSNAPTECVRCPTRYAALLIRNCRHKENIARIANAALHKLHGKLGLNVRSVCSVCPLWYVCPVWSNIDTVKVYWKCCGLYVGSVLGTSLLIQAEFLRKAQLVRYLS